MIHLTESIIGIKVPVEAENFKVKDNELVWDEEFRTVAIECKGELVGVMGAGSERIYNNGINYLPHIAVTVLINKITEAGIDLTKEKVVIIKTVFS